jgi:hypothetical protein
MLPWIENALNELEASAAEAERRFNAADDAHTKATDALDDARNHWITVRDLLKQFREYSDSLKSEGQS